MAGPRKPSLLGAAIGGAVGLSKGASLGTAAALATAPFLGPLALVFLPLGVGGGTAMGVKVGSKGLGHAALMTTTLVGGDILHDVLSSGPDPGIDIGGADTASA